MIISFLYGVNVFSSYLLMLAAMSFNVGWFFAIVTGLATGHYLFFRGPAKTEGPVVTSGSNGCGCGC